MRLAGKVVVVTGAGSGLGQALALELLRRGARVAAVDLRSEGLQETMAKAGSLGEGLSLHPLDITDKEKVAALPEEVARVHGQVDGLINNAGIIQPFKRLLDLDEAAMERVMRVNFWGTLHMTRAFLPRLLKRPEAHLVNVSSMGAFVPVPGQALYGASKAAVMLLTEALWAELQGTPVRVPLVLPGSPSTRGWKPRGRKGRRCPSSSPRWRPSASWTPWNGTPSECSWAGTPRPWTSSIA